MRSASSLSPTPDSFTFALEESECVSRSGTTKSTYRLRVGDAWKPVQYAPDARTERLPTSPGVVWRRVIRLRLAVGAELEQWVEVTRRDGTANTSDVLFGRSPGLSRSRRITQFVVAKDGKLSSPTRR